MKRDLSGLSSRQFDGLVIGGGIHGALAAWDATLRGLSVALIERGDFGGATSQNSLKIIHGGLRYLQDGNLARIRSMARERSSWMKMAPHLVHPLTCLTPTRQKISRSRLALGIALTLNDLLSFDRHRMTDLQKTLPAGSIVSQHELAHRLPGYDVNGSTGAAVWHDAQVYNSERLLLEFILSAVDEGAEVANYVEATDFLQTENQITGVRARDVQTGDVFDIQAKVVINCTGTWIDNLLERVSVESEYATSIAMNLIVDQVWSGVAAGLPSRPVNGRPPQILFFVPWRNKTMIGTWHIPWNKSPDAFEMKDAFVQGFINEINSAHPALKLSMEKVHHITWGFLPVNGQGAHEETVRLTRDGVVIDHQAKNGLSGLISVLGVKYTTARQVAEQAVDLAVDKLSVKTPKCQTHVRPVHGGQIGDFKGLLNQALGNAPRNMNEEIIEHLVYTHGSDYQHFVNEMIEHPELRERIDPHLPVTVAEIIHAFRHEMALTLADVIRRRTELGATGLPSINVLQKCAELMGCELGWSVERQQQEIDCVIQGYPLKQMQRITA
jgi:glycerol-3-phosphate dehydrogenase